jgi:hypothetical protein
VHCPRCGTPNEPGDRFCSSCGASLRKTSSDGEEGRPPRARLGRIVGETRKARLLTVGTVLAIAIAIAGFIALSPKDEAGIPRDSYTLAAERACISAKRQIVAAEQSAVRHAKRRERGAVARALVPIVATWRAELSTLKTPDDRTEQAGDLDRALRNVEIQVAKLALVADKGTPADILAQAKRVDAETAAVEAAVAALGLEECAGETIGFARPKG